MGKINKRLSNLTKKKLPWLVVLFLFGVVLLTAGNLIPDEKEVGDPVISGLQEENQAGAVEQKNPADLALSEQDMEKKLEGILGAVDGVGSVSVTVSLENGPQKVYASNANTNERKIEENDSSGGHRITTETTENDQMVLAQPASMNGQQPVVVKELRPEIAGVLVVAEGAEDSEVKVILSRAVQTLLNIPAHRVVILPKEPKY